MPAHEDHPQPLAHRDADHEIEDLFLKRVSWRALSPAVTEKELHQCLEAARWAPSTYNEQEWRFLYAMAGSDEFETFFDLLGEGNQPWCRDAGVLLAVCSLTKFTRNGKPNTVHEYDAGASAMCFALQAAAIGLTAHQMAGFDKGRARHELGLPDDAEVHSMIALGRPGDPDKLSEDYRKLEEPTGRKPLAEISTAGKWSF